MYEPVNLKLDTTDLGLVQWSMFSRALEKLAGPIDDDIMDRVASLVGQPGGEYEIARLLEVDPALVLLAAGLTEGLAMALFDLLEG